MKRSIKTKYCIHRGVIYLLQNTTSINQCAQGRVALQAKLCVIKGRTRVGRCAVWVIFKHGIEKVDMIDGSYSS